MAYCKSSKKLEDFFGNAPDIVIDKILENMPIHEAAKMSVLSKKWTRAWLSLNNFVIDYEFWKKLRNEDGSCDLQKCSNIIDNILLHHIGPVHYFNLFYMFDPSVHHMIHSQWIAFLSKNGVRKIVMNNCFLRIDITPYIFLCSELVHLELSNFKLNPLPTDFGGFPNLKYLNLQNVFVKQNVLCSLIENCRKLETLELDHCSGIDDIVIDAPSLQSLILTGDFESLAFGNICSLKRILIAMWTKMPKKVDIVRLASCCQLQSIDFDDYLCKPDLASVCMRKLFAAGNIVRASPVTFNQVDELSLCYLNLDDSCVFRSLLSMMECCPNIKKLKISIISGENVSQDILDCCYNIKMDHLREVNIEGIRGSSAELKLVEYLLAISVVLENLSFKYGKLDIESEVKISRALMKFPRVSPKASLVCLEK